MIYRLFLRQYLLCSFILLGQFIFSQHNIFNSYQEDDNVEYIYYDNGSPFSGGSQQIPGDQIAFKLTPKNYPFKLITVAINFAEFKSVITDSVIIHIYGEDKRRKPGNMLMKELKIACTRSEYYDTPIPSCWYLMDLSEKNIVINNGSYFVSVEWITPNSPELGMGNYGSNTFRTLVYEKGKWQLLATAYPNFAYRHMMVRSVGVVLPK